ncbi:VaFE repeat-containing surface-anchored protein [Enterococcus faecalis]|nr:VaFE repeat-containing surface-anchored protein [Enterococcus gallinarum]MBF0825268.1 VaFE repeat-containing surface-anchored protein [Enterococcus faecalis]MBF0798913.1 VaFE repeat-containing surface-anchored protein [Enterococcus gallinarum]MBX8979365.1 VaFE repeat-containing surface-anchored protein [Enterococcus gallinarum]MDL4886720.1 VaFE repeat-containing surface-anchored protein [Enterococcus gallinarum]UXA04075.1 VaFE repeat-containing surface-anchored protein [Enterococcus gallina
MQLRTRKKWLKAAVLLAFSQFCFLTGTFQAQAEETTPSQPTVETTEPAPVEAVEVQSVEEAVPATETSAESVPKTDAPTTNSKAVLDQTIGEAQNPGDSPAVIQPVEAEISPESSEESTSSTTQPSESAETMDTTEETTAKDKSTSELPASAKPSVEKVTDTPATDMEKPVEQPVDNKDTEETTEDSVVVSDKKENTMTDKEMKDTFVVTQPTNTRVRRAVTSTRAANTATVHEKIEYASNGLDWGSAILPNGTSFTYDGVSIFDVDGKIAFCVEPGVRGASGIFTESALSTYIKDANLRKKIALISYYGYTNSKDKSLNRRIATQFLIHEQLGSRFYGTNSILNYDAFKKDVLGLVSNYDKKASFNNQTKTVKVGETIKVPDTNNILKDVVKINVPKGVTAKIQGNQLVLTVTKDVSEKTSITLSKIKVMGAPLVYRKAGVQTVGLLNFNEPNDTVLNLNVLKQGNLEILKIDAKTKKPLANAEIKVTINGKDQTVKTDENGKATIKNLTHGTKGSVVEVKAPTGYVLNKTSKDFTIEANKTIKVTIENKEQKGIARIFKEDSKTGNNSQGAATLEGAVYGLYQANGTKIKSVTLKNINGKVQAEVKDLKLSSYYWLEEKAPVGYNLNTNKIHFELVYGDQDKETVTKEVIAKDQVIKGTIEGVKVGNKDFVDTNNPDNKPKLEGIEISLTSKTTGKVVKAVLTDKDGYFTFGKNSVVFDTYIVSETKGKEGYKLFDPFEVTISKQGQTFRYVLEDQIIEQQVKIVKVDQETGKTIALANTEFKIFDTLANKYITFAIPNDTEVTDIFRTNDKGYLVTNGTFTYGVNRYRLEEINAPKNYLLNKTPLVFSITDDTEPIKVINFANRQARKNVKLFKYEEWNKKKTPLAGVTFTLYNGEGKALGEYTTDTNGELLVKGLVAGSYYFTENAPLESFQPNTDKQAFTVVFKQNAPDDGETLLVSVRNYLIPPTLETQASNKEDGKKVIDPLEKVVIKDSVSYTNLFVGKEYTISGVLMNKATNAPILQDGKEIRKTLTFIADKANGTKDLEFVTNASALKGQTIVVFEKLFRDGIEVAAHEDITDENQSVRVNNPTVHTTAVFEDGLTVADPTGRFTLNDTVEVKEILPGKAYLVKGILMDKATGEPLLVHGNTVETSVGFIAKAENETVIVPFTFDLTDLNGREIVVFESLFRNDEELANHKDINDKGQTVRVTNPSVRTTATHKPTGLKVVNPLTKVTITDAVKYHDLIVGKTYTVTGILMDKAMAQPVLVDGKEVTSTLTFVAERTDGTVNLDFVLDARALRGKEVVVFEDLFRDGVLLASHVDITDKDQTIKIVNPTITTKATNANGGKEILALPNQTVLEWVKVDGLAIGQFYKLIVQGYLTPDGTPFEGTHAEKIFTADKETMEFLFEFLVDGCKLAGKGLSFSEWLQAKTEDDKEPFEEVARHNVDLTNKDQTVQIVEAPKPPQPMKPEQPVKEASMMPTLPKTGSEDNVLWIMIGMIFVLAAGLIGYDLYKVKD